MTIFDVEIHTKNPPNHPQPHTWLLSENVFRSFYTNIEKFYQNNQLDMYKQKQRNVQIHSKIIPSDEGPQDPPQKSTGGVM